MELKKALNRRKFMGGVAAALGYAGLRPEVELFAQGATARTPRASADYDTLVKIGSNENPYGPSENVLKAMQEAFKYANRYGYPDRNVAEEIAKFHGVKEENIVLGAGSGELLDVINIGLLLDHKKVIGTDPTFEQVYSYCTSLKGEAIKVPLLKDYRLDIPGMIKATKANYRDVGFVYVCNPNNPTGVVVTKQEIKQLSDALPADIPILMDEAYHHFVDDPNYGTSIPYVIEGRPFMVLRTFSKIAALAGVRLGYMITTPELAAKLRPYTDGAVSAIAKYAGVASLKDVANEAKVRKMTIDIRNKCAADLKAYGYDVIPSQTNFFMVHVRKDVTPVIAAFREKGVLVGRKFPPMVEHLRVSIGSEADMAKFMTVFKELFPAGKSSTSGAA